MGDTGVDQCGLGAVATEERADVVYLVGGFWSLSNLSPGVDVRKETITTCHEGEFFELPSWGVCLCDSGRRFTNRPGVGLFVGGTPVAMKRGIAKFHNFDGSGGHLQRIKSKDGSRNRVFCQRGR